MEVRAHNPITLAEALWLYTADAETYRFPMKYLSTYVEPDRLRQELLLLTMICTDRLLFSVFDDRAAGEILTLYLGWAKNYITTLGADEEQFLGKLEERGAIYSQAFEQRRRERESSPQHKSVVVEEAFARFCNCELRGSNPVAMFAISVQVALNTQMILRLIMKNASMSPEQQQQLLDTITSITETLKGMPQPSTD